MGADKIHERNRQMLADIANGMRPKLVADQNNISRQRLHMICKSKTGQLKTLENLPGSESLSANTRGLLIRLGYTALDKVISDVRTGLLYAGCTFGMGNFRFEEIKRLAEAVGQPNIEDEQMQMVIDTQPEFSDESLVSSQKSWLATLVDKAIESSRRMENDPEYCREIQERTR